jgi:hypothetical protein
MVALNGQTSAEEARAGSYASLITRLRLGDDLIEEERQFLADFLEGKSNLAQHRPKSIDLELQQSAIAKLVDYFRLIDQDTGDLRSRPLKMESAVKDAALHLGKISESKVWKALAAAKKRTETPELKKTEQLHGIPHKVRIEVRTDPATGQPFNVITDWKRLDE